MEVGSQKGFVGHVLRQIARGQAKTETALLGRMPLCTDLRQSKVTSQTQHDGQDVTTELAQKVQAELMALPFDALLHYWQRLTWWTGVWPLFHRMNAMDLTLPEVMVLRILVRRSLNVAEVAKYISHSQSAASRFVDRMLGNRLVSRQEDPQDRRNKRLTLTPAGFERIEEIEQAFGSEMADITALLSPGEKDQLRSLLARLLAVFVVSHEEEPERIQWARELGVQTGLDTK